MCGVAATNCDLEADVEGRLRRDLHYRLAVFPVHIAALRERRMAIPLIAEAVLSAVKIAFNRPNLGPGWRRLPTPALPSSRKGAKIAGQAMGDG